jgi:hypothetical protein
MKKPIILLFITASLFFSCKKEISELPPATQTGANTFGAKVNGELWVPQGFGPIPANNLLEARKLPSGDVIINARNFSRSPNETEFELVIRAVTGPGNYTLSTANYGYYVKRNITPENEWQTNAQYTGTINITKLDTVTRFVSGTFQFNAINLYNTPQPLNVTEGRFDVKFL